MPCVAHKRRSGVAFFIGGDKLRLQPITRKERFLYEIVGWGETAPEKPLTPEEFFFAAILGEAVQTPEPLSRYQIYLAKIAGRNISVPKPLTRLELFLAKACGMDIETPTPITREEIFWSNYSAIVDFEVEGVPPLTYRAIEGTLENYRIYGDTVDGESVGDRTGNLFDGFIQGIRLNTLTGFEEKNNTSYTSGFIGVENDKLYSYSGGSDTTPITFFAYDSSENYIGRSANTIRTDTIIYTSTTSSNYTSFYANLTGNTSPIAYIRITYVNAEQTVIDDEQIMLNLGSTPLPYEPYGYKVPVTVNSGTVNIYLDEQLTKSGDNADYIDYATQKRYNADGTTVDVELPTLQTVEGTNTLSVGTTVQPSKVMVKIGEASAYKVRYYVDDTMARVETVSDGKNAQGFTPTKASTAQYNYTFMGWSTTKGSTTAETGVLSDITADKSLYAVFSQSLRTFTVYFYNGSTLLQTAENVQYGGTATYTGEAPTKDGFTFSGWQPSNVNITADTSCYAQFVEG